jgi:endonuclease/exonuclease/phosphatase family metal-dependent hydrolase
MEISVHVQDATTTDPIEAAYVRYIFNPGTVAVDTVDGYTDATGGLLITHDLVSSVNDLPGFAVSRPYPNPAASTAYFDVQSPDKAATALSFALYDLRGRLVGNGEVGDGSVVLDRPLVSGSYLYRLYDGCSVKTTGKLAVLGRLERVVFTQSVLSGSSKVGADPVDILVQATGYEDHTESQLLGDGNHLMTFNLVSQNPFDGLTFGGDSTFEVMTWNLQQFPKNGTVTVDIVIQIIESLEIDIIALQEIQDSYYFNQLRESLAGWDGIRATSAPYDWNLAFLYRIDSDLQVDSAYEILVDNAREFPRRPFVLEGSYKGNPFEVINNHYKCCGDGIIDEDEYWDEETRRRDASLLLDDYIQTHFTNKAVIVVGDFNDILTDIPADNVFQNFIDAPGTYSFVDFPIAQDPEELWSFPSWPIHIDHILITHQLFDAIQGDEALVEVSPLHTYFEQGLNGYIQILSDHLPVLMKISWPQP